MDAFIVILLALTILLFDKTPVVDDEDENFDRSSSIKSVKYEEREMKLNDNYYDDPDAFMEMAHALGFRNSE